MSICTLSTLPIAHVLGPVDGNMISTHYTIVCVQLRTVDKLVVLYTFCGDVRTREKKEMTLTLC